MKIKIHFSRHKQIKNLLMLIYICIDIGILISCFGSKVLQYSSFMSEGISFASVTEYKWLIAY